MERLFRMIKSLLVTIYSDEDTESKINQALTFNHINDLQVISIQRVIPNKENLDCEVWYRTKTEGESCEKR